MGLWDRRVWMEIEMTNKNIATNQKGWKIKTNKGFVDFYGVAFQGTKQLYRITFDDGSSIEVTSKHRFFTTDGREIQTRELTTGIELIGTVNRTVADIKKTQIEQTYDIIESEDHVYFANGLLCHNCEFLSSEALLIKSITLANMTPRIERIQPVNVVYDNKTDAQVMLWYDIKPGGTYLVGVDPATGSGEDYSVITIFEFPSLLQVGEYRSNTMSTNDLYNVLKNVLKHLEKQKATVYFSIENNGVGEGIISLYEADETPPATSEFISEEGKNRRGMVTTSKTKMRACVNLKEMIEKGTMEISSKILLAELKMFVRTRGAYDHQPGGTADCVSAVLIITRLIEEIATYDQTAFDKLYSGEFDEWGSDEWDGYEGGYDANDEGMPITF